MYMPKTCIHTYTLTEPQCQYGEEEQKMSSLSDHSLKQQDSELQDHAAKYVYILSGFSSKAARSLEQFLTIGSFWVNCPHTQTTKASSENETASEAWSCPIEMD